jgi:hypothetical protein
MAEGPATSLCLLFPLERNLNQSFVTPPTLLLLTERANVFSPGKPTRNLEKNERWSI